MAKTDILTKQAPKAIGPYSQAIKNSNMIFISGQLGIKPDTGEFAGKDIKKQTKQAFENIKNILFSAGADFDNVVRVDVFLKDLKDYSSMNQVYESYFNSPFPARAAVEVSRLPKDALIEIALIAMV